MKVCHFEEQPAPPQEPHERKVTVQESGNLYRIRHGMEQSKPTLRLVGA
jgi:hypothetical protein